MKTNRLRELIKIVIEFSSVSCSIFTFDYHNRLYMFMNLIFLVRL